MGGGIFCVDSPATVTNTILWDNAAPTAPEIGAGYGYTPISLTLISSDVKGGSGSVYVQPGATLNWGPGMIDVDPKFVDSRDGDFHIRYTSPCRDAGDNSVIAEPCALGMWWIDHPMVITTGYGAIRSDGILVCPVSIPATPTEPYTVYLQAMIDFELTELCTVSVQ